MPERTPLDLSGIARQYDLFGPVARPEPPVLPGDSDGGYCFATAPVRLGYGPPVWSTSTALVPVVLVCHDVNGYYRELGVHWRATRRELMGAYTALDGQSSARLTYVFKQLLNPVTRRMYDETPAGEMFLDDYTADDLKRNAHREVRRRAESGRRVTSEEIMNEWGYVVLDDGVDSVSSIGKDLGQPRKTPWGYSYYAWKTTGYSIDESRLQCWQDLLSTAASGRGRAPRMAIGMTALSDQPYMLGDVNGTRVVFFSETVSPVLSIAEEAIELFLASPTNPAEIPEESRVQ